MNLTIEEGLKRLEDRAAMLRFMADAAAASTHDVPEPAVFSGLADTCAEIVELARATRRSLSVEGFRGSTPGEERERSEAVTERRRGGNAPPRRLTSELVSLTGVEHPAVNLH